MIDIIEWSHDIPPGHLDDFEHMLELAAAHNFRLILVPGEISSLMFPGIEGWHEDDTEVVVFWDGNPSVTDNELLNAWMEYAADRDPQKTMKQELRDYIMPDDIARYLEDL